MRTWCCGNCGLEFDRPQPANRCACGMYLDLRMFCDKPSCDRQLIGSFIEASDGRVLCNSHLAEVLRISIALEVPA
jgi:hypothetical protein